MATNTQIARGGIAQFGAPDTEVTVWHTGDAPPSTTTTGTDTTPVVTETYVARIFVAANSLITGISLLNGSAVAGNVTAIIYDRNGIPLAQSASTAQSGTAAYQDFALASPIRLRGPGLHFVGFQFNNTSARFRTHILGRFTAFKKTGETYGTATALTSPNTFTTGVGPIASTY
jgi:hypothetical protein